MNVDCQFEINSKSLERFCGRNTAYGYKTEVILLLGILHFAHLISNPMRGIHLRFTTSCVYPAQVFRDRCLQNVLAKRGYSATFQSLKWATLLSDVRSVTPFKLKRPPTPARYSNRLFLWCLLFTHCHHLFLLFVTVSVPNSFLMLVCCPWLLHIRAPSDWLIDRSMDTSLRNT
jgi:hypothetical protein